VYRAIVRKFRAAKDGKPQSRIWLFGLSRGAYIVRSVAGMINNLGIIDVDRLHIRQVLGENLTHEQRQEEIFKALTLACESLYDTYRSPDPRYKPGSPFCKDFKASRSHPTDKPPVRFMGLLDTVGALGVPKIVAGGKLR
jgi:uncharacterized protein (DUF2235 family)